MQFIFTLMNEENARSIQNWRYDEPYAIYNYSASEESLAELLERRSPYYAVCNEQGTLLAFFCYGSAAQVWGSDVPTLYSEGRVVDIGLGLRPDLTGKGLGLALVKAGLAFANRQFAPCSFRLFVLAFNRRAIRVYERVGFARTRELTRQNPVYGELTFLEMRREANLS